MPLHDEPGAVQAEFLENATPAIERLERCMAASDAAQISDLHSVSRSLEQLEKELAADRVKQIEGLRNFEADESLERLRKLAEDQRIEFDAFDFIGRLSVGTGRGLWGSEEFHSRVLVWLLDPGESHGLGDCFLKSFLLSAGVQPEDVPSDWSATVVTREWPNMVDGQRGFLDILVVNEAQQVLCAIENKVFSPEHSEQLTRYRRALKDHFPTFARRHLFLTPEGTHPASEKEQRHWKPVKYSMVFDVVKQIVKNDEIATTDGIGAFLRQYATALRRNIMPETSVSQLARSIYLEHREAIDLIAANEPDWMAEAKQWLREAVARHKEWELEMEDSRFLRFRSVDWDKRKGMRMGTGWASNALLLFQFRFDKGLPRPWFDLGLSRGNDDNNRLRQKLFEKVRQHPQLFRPGTISLSDSWAILHDEPDYVLDDADYGVGWDDGTTRDKLEKWIEDFAANRFPAMNEIIVNCLREYEAEGQNS